MVNGKPAGNFLLSGAISFTGVSATPTLRMLRYISVQTFSLTTYYKYQSSFLVPAVEKVWLEEQNQLIDQMRGQAIDVSGDGRCDSSGFSAKYMTYNLHVDQINKIIHSAQIQLAENERVMASGGSGQCPDGKGRTDQKHPILERARSLFIRTAEGDTAPVPSDCGVPQGSVLSPLLFNVVMAGLEDCTGRKVYFSLYADDICIWTTGKSRPAIQRRLQSTLNSIHQYLFTAGLDIS
ncbi:uncharacterized protein LOC135391498 isoform X2 [Ornithodoros turicata]|uniref:uncharacterized protein LOC135391498 isoform X2 n=1 Tax=Ornithodoros turicata TaxID=34597 RepID=UPI0031387527